ncbi:hypothetical protein Pla175_43810 [Pirellulimonas nuda]|uniref:Uncharacterized protein n=1 Tax=Pirellulimonas nuda TaxID=2528009 RepID=A0A518DHL3_9BACT|nr:hypothetical protein [Pirellulimonas nuda]QDU90967.1 hypothetical protein Pla175_43810 [Pirellulimonas nuda]
MSGPSPENSSPLNAGSATAESVAAWWGVDADLVGRCLDKIIGHCARIHASEEAKQRYQDLLEDALRAAFSHDGDAHQSELGTRAEQLLEEFAASDLDQMYRRVGIIDQLVDGRLPVLQIDELAKQIQDFHDFQVLHEEALLGTGLPPEMFPGLCLLHEELGRLYDARVSSPLYPPRLGPGVGYPLGPSPYKWYRWVIVNQTLPIGSGLFHGQARENAAGESAEGPDWPAGQKVLAQCHMEDADPHRFLCMADVVGIEQFRPQFFKVRLQVLADLAKALSTPGRGADLLGGCLSRLGEEFDRSDIDYLLAFDRRYVGGDAAGCGTPQYSKKSNPGGLSNLVRVVSQMECECRFGTWDSVARRAPQCLKGPSTDALPQPGFAVNWRGYFAAALVAQRVEELRKELDCFCDDLIAAQEEVDGYLQEIPQRVRIWLDDSVEVTVCVRVDPRVASIIEEALPVAIEKMTTTALDSLQASSDQAAATARRYPEGPLGLNQWVWNGKIVEVTMQPMQAKVARLLFAADGKPVDYADLAKACWGHNENVEDGTIYKQGNLLNEYFRKHKVPLKVAPGERGGPRQMILLETEQPAISTE